MKLWKLCILAANLLLLYSAGNAGQTGKIAGTVKDAKTGEKLFGVNIIIEGKPIGAASDIDGSYTILNIPPGKYNLVASALGYAKRTVTEISVSIDLTTTINFELEESALQGQEVVITAERPVVKKDLTSSEARVDASQIKTLPVSEISQVLTLQSGITVDQGGGIHIRGGRTSEVAYWVDGVSVSDVYDGSQAVQVDNNSVQELQVISGTFNAEYGSAMSGIVNIVTKTGEPQYHGNLSMYAGGYFTSDGGNNNNRTETFDPSFGATLLTDKIFYNLDKLRPFDNRNIEASLSGPVEGIKDLSFYVSGRYFKSNGWFYGNRVLNTDGTIDTSAATLVQIINGIPTVILHDNAVPMNDRERFSGQAKLSYQFGATAKLSLSALGSKIDYRDYNHDWSLVPQGDVKKFDRGYDLSAVWTHTLNATSFYNVNLSYFYKGFKEHLYDDPFDSRYIIDPIYDVILQKGDSEFNHGGTNRHRFERKTETRVAKIDYTNQVSKLHELKIGAEGKLHRLYLEDYSLIPLQDANGIYIPGIPGDTSAEYEQYTEKPVEFSFYVQDKLEYEHMIVNVGLRYDYFNSKGNVLTDPYDPNVFSPQRKVNQSLTLQERLQKWYKKASVKSLFSPRFGISYPITDKGILHFSYGHFLQIPSFIHLYQKPGYKVTTASGIQGVYGNPDLNAQKTVMYEIGLQQQLNDYVSADITGFYRDTRDWVTTSPSIPVRDSTGSTVTSSYTQYINRDYANSRGITLSINKRTSNLWSLNFSYTFQVAEGINSNPDDAFASELLNKEPAQTLTPLDWDQTHTANLTLGIGENDWGVFVLGRYGSGLPYTPVVNKAESQGLDATIGVKDNSRRRPENYTIDLRLFKSFKLSSLTFSAFIKVFNLLDRRNETSVFGETGRATATPENLGAQLSSPQGRFNSVESYLIRPDFYSAPREIQFGFETEF